MVRVRQMAAWVAKVRGPRFRRAGQLPSSSDEAFAELEKDLPLRSAVYRWGSVMVACPGPGADGPAVVRGLLGGCSVAGVPPPRLAFPVTGPPGTGARRARGGPVEEVRVAAGGAMAAALGAFSVFEYESKVSNTPSTAHRRADTLLSATIRCRQDRWQHPPRIINDRGNEPYRPRRPQAQFRLYSQGNGRRPPTPGMRVRGPCTRHESGGRRVVPTARGPSANTAFTQL